MGERNIDDLEAAEPPKAEPKVVAPAPVKPGRTAEAEKLVDVNYPEPTSIAKIVRDVARWSGQSFVMEPRLDAKIQIFAPKPLRPSEAYQLFQASLQVLGLRAVQLGTPSGIVVKIVPVQPIVGA